MTPDYETIFKPYCFGFITGKNKEETKFMLDNINQAFELFQSVFDTDHGTIRINENLISIHTGGWSENEVIITEFEKTLWWLKHFKIYKTGGHYFFDTGGSKEWQIIQS